MTKNSNINRFRFNRICTNLERERCINKYRGEIEGCVDTAFEDPEVFLDLAIAIINFYKLEKYREEFEGWADILPYKEKSKDRLVEVLKNLYEAVNDNNRLGYLRGAVLERITERLIRLKFSEKNCLVEIDCEIYLDGNIIKTDLKKTVDVAGCNEKNAEFFEAKVHPNRVEFDNVDFLLYLNNLLKEEGVVNKIFCVSFEREKNLRKKIEKIVLNYGTLSDGDEEKFLLWGREEIKNEIKNEIKKYAEPPSWGSA